MSAVDVLAFFDSLDWTPEVDEARAAVAELIEELECIRDITNRTSCDICCDVSAAASAALARVQGEG